MREQLDGGNVKGGVLKAHLDWYKGQHDALGVERLRRRVSLATGEILGSTILPTNWYPFRAVVEMDRAIAAIQGGDERETIIGLGRHSARLNLTTSYRAFATHHPHEFFRISARLHHQYEDFGRARYEEMGPMHCRLSLVDCPCYAKTYCWSALGYFEEAAAIEGGHAPRVLETECVCDGGTACRFEIRWTAPPVP